MTDFLGLCQINQHFAAPRAPDADVGLRAVNAALSPALLKSAQAEITQWAGYRPTPVHALSPMAERLGIAALHYKDESGRFGLGSFKALGGAYAVMRAVADLLTAQGEAATPASVRRGQHQARARNLTVATATDGNHGRSVAWGAQMAGCACQIFIHRDVSEGRAAAMAEYGAHIQRIDGDYDESVRACAKAAQAHGWQVISDTSWEGYTEPPSWVMAGYTVMVAELLDSLSEPPTHIFLPAGVGGLAAAVSAAYWQALGARLPRIVIVESELAACVIESARQQQAAEVPIEAETIMAGLSCGETSPLAWDILSRAASDFLTISDAAVPAGMRMLASGAVSDAPIEAGECALAGLIGLAGACQAPALRAALKLDASARVLVLGTEGATDPEIYQRILRHELP